MIKRTVDAYNLEQVPLNAVCDTLQDIPWHPDRIWLGLYKEGENAPFKTVASGQGPEANWFIEELIDDVISKVGSTPWYTDRILVIFRRGPRRLAVEYKLTV